MTAMNYQRALELTLSPVIEGGWADHPEDNGGPTMRGITIGTYSNWLGRKATVAELRAIPIETVRLIYRKRYWDAVKGDDLPAGVDLAVFDAGILSGPGTAARWLQESVGVVADGKIGPVTLQAVRHADEFDLIDRIAQKRMSLMRRHQDWSTFGRGWTSRVNHISTTAKSWVPK